MNDGNGNLIFETKNSLCCTGSKVALKNNKL